MIETLLKPQNFGHETAIPRPNKEWKDKDDDEKGPSDGLTIENPQNANLQLEREQNGGNEATNAGEPIRSLSGKQEGYPFDYSFQPTAATSSPVNNSENDVSLRAMGEIDGEYRNMRLLDGGTIVNKHDLVLEASEANGPTEEQVFSLEEEEPHRRREKNFRNLMNQASERDKVLKLSPAEIHELTSSPQSLPLRALPNDLPPSEDHLNLESTLESNFNGGLNGNGYGHRGVNGFALRDVKTSNPKHGKNVTLQEGPLSTGGDWKAASSSTTLRPVLSERAASSPSMARRTRSPMRTEGTSHHRTSQTRNHRTTPAPLQLSDRKANFHPPTSLDPQPSPMPPTIPLPPLSIPTYLQLELSSARPSPLYIHRSVTSDFPYESSRVKIERLQNFLLLPPQLEQILWFGSLACFDAWLYTFTILPLRFAKALYILGQSWAINLGHEVDFVSRFIVKGVGRMWRRRRRQSITGPPHSQLDQDTPKSPQGTSQSNATSEKATASIQSEKHPESEKSEQSPKARPFSMRNHRRSKSTPSSLLPDDKADILKGLLIIFTCTILMSLDASRMYHWVRGQAAIKLYVIYNVLEVCDRLFSAIGQDILECLFSREALERRPDGRSKVLRPLWLFSIALVYTIIHSAALFYQVITLNVAVNSYSNALITLLMSNQFVEIKSTVFKKFEKENLFQLTCADVVERFQLWLMLTIIASRNIVETGGLNFGSSSASPTNPNLPPRSTSILPKSFTMFPEWTGQVLAPFFLVLGSEMVVDWLKHSYITKFNNTKPAIYGRFLDILAKDYYSNAFADQNLTRRLGLPIIPLSCLFIRAAVQTYHMFLATHLPLPMPSASTSLAVENTFPDSTAPTSTSAALARLDALFRRALGRSSFPDAPSSPFSIWNPDDFTALLTRILLFLLAYLLLLIIKLCVGMALLAFSRRRYRSMKERENEPVHAEGRRVGGWGVVEVDEDKRRWIYRDDVGGLGELRMREKELKERERKTGGEGGLDERLQGVRRWGMVGKRIW